MYKYILLYLYDYGTYGNEMNSKPKTSKYYKGDKGMKKKTLLTSIASIAMCASLVGGATFALFTDESNVNIAVTSGKVDVEATVVESSLKTWSLNEENARTDGTFANGGTAVVTDSSTLALNLMTPGDKAAFTVDVTNKSNVAIQYRVKMTAEGELAPALVANATMGESDAKQSFVAGGATTWTYVGAKEEIADIDISIEFPNTDNSISVNNADNAYRDKKASITITVEAVQGNAETSSVLASDGKSYKTLDEAIDAAEPGTTINLSGAHNVTGAAGTSQVRDLKGLTIIGDGDTTITFKNVEGSNSTGTCSFNNVTIKNIDLVDETFYTGENGENAWEFTYLEFGGENTFVDVVFEDGIFIENGHSTFKGCTFNGHNNDSSEYGNTTMYGVWVYSGSADFDNCKFIGTRGLKVADQYAGSDVTAVTVADCYFGPLSEKPGIAVDNRNGELLLTIKNSKFVDTQPGDGASNAANGVPYIYENDNRTPDDTTITLENNSAGKSVSTKDELLAFANDVENGVSYNVILTNDIDLADVEWNPIDVASGKGFMFDGNGKTISNLTVNGTSSVGFFGSISSKTTVKDVTFDKATVKGIIGLVLFLAGKALKVNSL